MSVRPASQPIRAVASGLACLAVLMMMLVLHAWPLWTGRVVSVEVTVTPGRDAFRGERLDIALPGARVIVGDPTKTAAEPAAVVLPAKGGWWDTVPADIRGRRRVLAARVVYLQLAPDVAGSRYRAVSISDAPDPGTVNLKGRIRRVDSAGVIEIDYGLDSYYVQEHEPLQPDRSVRAGSQAQAQIAIAGSGRARIKSLVVNGTTL